MRPRCGRCVRRDTECVWLEDDARFLFRNSSLVDIRQSRNNRARRRDDAISHRNNVLEKNGPRSDSKMDEPNPTKPAIRSSFEVSTMRNNDDLTDRFLLSSGAAEVVEWASWLADMPFEEDTESHEGDSQVQSSKNAGYAPTFNGEPTADDFAVLDAEDGWFMGADVWTDQETIDLNTSLSQRHDSMRGHVLPVSHTGSTNTNYLTGPVDNFNATAKNPLQ